MASKNIKTVFEELKKSTTKKKKVTFSTQISEELASQLSVIRKKEGLTQPQLLETLVHLYQSESSAEL